MIKNINRKYQKRAQRWACFLVKMPGVSAIFLSGSLSLGNATKESDIDFFIVTTPGRIFTARFFVAGILKIFGLLATDSQNHAGKICPNHYITTDNLEIQEKDAYAAKLFSHNQFLAGDERIWHLFVEKNKMWMEGFKATFRNIKNSNETQPLLASSRRGKITLVSQKLEFWYKKIQQNKISKNKLPKTAKVWLTDTEIRLHAEPKNLV